jgi:hypothetical protein
MRSVEDLLPDSDRRHLAEWYSAPPPRPLFSWMREQGAHLVRLSHEDYAEGNAGLAMESLAAGDLVSALLHSGRAVAQWRVYGATRHPSSGLAADRFALGQEYQRVGEEVVQQQMFSVRCVAGNPTGPVTFSPSWRTEAVVAVARTMYDARDFGPMPVLADALDDAWCDQPDILAHCRGEGPQVRSCWVVDLVLGKA